jgi:ABC-type transport system involved in multi-copper enzyme maturation permease subunit
MFDNPVFIKEIKAKYRARQSNRVLIGVGSSILLLIGWFYFEALRYLLSDTAEIGWKTAWSWSVILLMLILWAVGPALASNAISQEREQQTWELLTFTLLSPREIVLGKLLARSLPLLFLFLAFCPFMVFCLILGDIPFESLPLTYLVLGICSAFILTLSLFMSWLAGKTATAIALSYLVVAYLVIGTILIESVIQGMITSVNESPNLWLNPIRITMALLESPREENHLTALLFSQTCFLALTILMLHTMIRLLNRPSRG